MKTENILYAMEQIDSSMIEEAETYNKAGKRAPWGKWVSAAACLCLVAAGTMAAVYFQKDRTLKEKNAEISTGKNNGNSMLTGEILTGEPIQTVDGGNSGVKSSEPGSSSLESPKAGNGSLSEASQTANAGDSLAESGNLPQEESGVVDLFGKEKQEAAGKMLDRFDKSLNRDADMAVNNGHFVLSGSLQAALEEYGDRVVYRVVVEVFQNGTVIANNSAEAAAEETRLAGEGYIVAHEKYEDAAGGIWDYFTIHANKEQLLSFPVNQEFGYYLTFYSEYPGLDRDLPVDESSSEYLQAVGYPSDILAMQEHISSGMISGELSFIYESAIYENPLRIEVSVGTVGEEKMEEFKALYDPTGKYIVIRQGAKAVLSEELNGGKVEKCYDNPENPVENQNYDVGKPQYEKHDE